LLYNHLNMGSLIIGNGIAFGICEEWSHLLVVSMIRYVPLNCWWVEGRAVLHQTKLRLLLKFYSSLSHLLPVFIPVNFLTASCIFPLSNSLSNSRSTFHRRQTYFIFKRWSPKNGLHGIRIPSHTRSSVEFHPQSAQNPRAVQHVLILPSGEPISQGRLYFQLYLQNSTSIA